MKSPYYSESGIEIYHGDCREILPTLPKCDLLCTDPPYANLSGGYSRMNLGGGVSPRIADSLAVGDVWNASFDWAPAAIEAAEFGCIVFCSFASIVETAAAFSGLKRSVFLTWHKRNSSPTGKNVPRFTEEYAWGFSKKPGLKWDGFKSTMLDLPTLPAGCFASERFLDSAGVTIHPTQKPVALMKWAISAVQPHSVMDPFCGTGTTLRAAKDLGLKAIGIEIEEKYAEIAARRLSQGVLDFRHEEKKTRPCEGQSLLDQMEGKEPPLRTKDVRAVREVLQADEGGHKNL